eukprot:scaffold267803_cov37-Tisochrysis_lutea.AAC.4
MHLGDSAGVPVGAGGAEAGGTEARFHTLPDGKLLCCYLDGGRHVVQQVVHLALHRPRANRSG